MPRSSALALLSASSTTVTMTPYCASRRHSGGTAYCKLSQPISWLSTTIRSITRRRSGRKMTPGVSTDGGGGGSLRRVAGLDRAVGSKERGREDFGPGAEGGEVRCHRLPIVGPERRDAVHLDQLGLGLRVSKSARSKGGELVQHHRATDEEQCHHRRRPDQERHLAVNRLAADPLVHRDAPACSGRIASTISPARPLIRTSSSWGDGSAKLREVIRIRPGSSMSRSARSDSRGASCATAGAATRRGAGASAALRITGGRAAG